MGKSYEEFLATKSSRNANKKKKEVKHPPKFTPGVSYSEETKSGEIVSSPQKNNSVDWKEQLESYFGKDASKYSVVPGTAEIRFWDSNIGNGNIERLYYFKAKIVSDKLFMPDDDFKLLLKEAKRKKPLDKPKKVKGKTLVIALSDWQIGKKGTEKTVEQFTSAIPKIKEHIKYLKKIEQIDQVLFAGLGDIVEGCTGFYDMQEFEVELDFRQQQKVARRMAYMAIKEIAPMFEKSIVCFIAGNHGQPRKNGKAFTSFGDNRDVQLAEELQEIFSEAPAFKDRIDFIIPDNELSQTFDISDVTITLAHGHQMYGGGNAQAKAKTWLANQSLARNEIADADILLMGHYHFFSSYETSDRLIIQAPTLDQGSEWFENTKGDRSNPGILTFLVGGKEKWNNINVIR